MLLILTAKFSVSFIGHPVNNSFLESFVVHVANENVLILVHPIHEKRFYYLLEYEREFVAWVHRCCLLQIRIAIAVSMIWSKKNWSAWLKSVPKRSFNM